MSGALGEGPVPLQSNKVKQISNFNEIEGQFQQPASADNDMNGNHKVHDTNHPEVQPWEPTPLPLLERNALIAHPDSQPYYLNLIQPPQEGRVNAGKSKGKPLACSLHPEPILELKTQDADPYNYHRTSPHFMCIVELVANDEVRSPVQDGLGGSLVSSLHNLRIKDDKDHAYFIFGDLCPKFVGTFCLKFVLFEMRSDSATSSNSTYAKLLTSIISQPFVIKEAKGVGISKASTPLTRMVAECGVKIRVRKEPTNKRKQSQTSWAVRGPTEPNPLRVQAPVLKDVLGFDPSQPQYPNYANSLGVHSQYASRPVQNPFPTHLGQMTPPTRGVEGILDRVSMQMPNSAQEGTSKTEDLPTDDGHLSKKVHSTQESHSNNHNRLNAGHLKQYRPNLSVMAGYGAQASPLNNDPAYQTPGSQFMFSGAINNFTSLTGEANTGPSTHFFNVPSGRNTQLSNMGPGFSPPMSASVSTTNSQMGNMVSPLRSRTGRDDGSSAGFGSRTQFSSFSSGLVDWDPLVTSTSSYDPLYSSSMPNNTQNPTNMQHSGSMLFASQNTGNASNNGSIPCTTPYSTSMSSTSQYIPRLPDATSQMAQYPNSMANATQDPISMAQMPFYNSQYPSSTATQRTQKFPGYEWQFGSGYGATPGMVSHG